MRRSIIHEDNLQAALDYYDFLKKKNWMLAFKVRIIAVYKLYNFIFIFSQFSDIF